MARTARKAPERLRVAVRETEAARELLRDLSRLGPTRTIHKLCDVLKKDYPHLAVSRPTLEKWSAAKRLDKQGQSPRRCNRHRPGTGASPLPRWHRSPGSGAQEFDQIDALLRLPIRR
jgi:hypothetical protein